MYNKMTTKVKSVLKAPFTEGDYFHTTNPFYYGVKRPALVSNLGKPFNHSPFLSQINAVGFNNLPKVPTVQKHVDARFDTDDKGWFQVKQPKNKPFWGSPFELQINGTKSDQAAPFYQASQNVLSTETIQREVDLGTELKSSETSRKFQEAITFIPTIFQKISKFSNDKLSNPNLKITDYLTSAEQQYLKVLNDKPTTDIQNLMAQLQTAMPNSIPIVSESADVSAIPAGLTNTSAPLSDEEYRKLMDDRWAFWNKELSNQKSRKLKREREVKEGSDESKTEVKVESSLPIKELKVKSPILPKEEPKIKPPPLGFLGDIKSESSKKLKKMVKSEKKDEEKKKSSLSAIMDRRLAVAGKDDEDDEDDEYNDFDDEDDKGVLVGNNEQIKEKILEYQLVKSLFIQNVKDIIISQDSVKQNIKNSKGELIVAHRYLTNGSISNGITAETFYTYVKGGTDFKVEKFKKGDGRTYIRIITL